MAKSKDRSKVERWQAAIDRHVASKIKDLRMAVYDWRRSEAGLVALSVITALDRSNMFHFDLALTKNGSFMRNMYGPTVRGGEDKMEMISCDLDEFCLMAAKSGFTSQTLIAAIESGIDQLIKENESSGE